MTSLFYFSVLYLSKIHAEGFGADLKDLEIELVTEDYFGNFKQFYEFQYHSYQF